MAARRRPRRHPRSTVGSTSPLPVGRHRPRPQRPLRLRLSTHLRARLLAPVDGEGAGEVGEVVAVAAPRVAAVLQVRRTRSGRRDGVHRHRRGAAEVVLLPATSMAGAVMRWLSVRQRVDGGAHRRVQPPSRPSTGPRAESFVAVQPDHQARLRGRGAGEGEPGQVGEVVAVKLPRRVVGVRQVRRGSGRPAPCGPPSPQRSPRGPLVSGHIRGRRGDEVRLLRPRRHPQRHRRAPRPRSRRPSPAPPPDPSRSLLAAPRCPPPRPGEGEAWPGW